MNNLGTVIPEELPLLSEEGVRACPEMFLFGRVVFYRESSVVFH